MKKSGLVRWLNVSAVVFFIISILVSSSTCKIGINRSSNGKPIYYCKEGYGFEHFNKYNVSEITPEDWEFNLAHSFNNKLTNLEEKQFIIGGSLFDSKPIGSIGYDGLIDSAWPMYCHDTKHTGRSPYSTIDTWDEIWRFRQDKNDYVRGSPVVGDNGTIYFGGMDFYALYPNGTMKWKYDDLSFYVWSAPAIDDSGVIYVGDCDGYLNAINPDGTEKWKIRIGKEILSSPAIGNDGIIYLGTSFYYPDGYFYAVYPNNGTVKWRYKTDHVVYSSPAIGEDGTIYCGSHDTYLYALYPNNGTLKWKYKTDGWIRVSPCIGDDGTIYVVSFDCYLHAVNPDGSLKWKTYMGNAGTSPTIGKDGTIYCGYIKLYAINPTNGSVKWTFDIEGSIQGSTPCNSIDGTIYFGSGCWLYAVNPDGTLKWRKLIANEFIDSAPAIGKDGTIYVGSADSENHGGYIYSVGYLHAIGMGPLKADADGPYYGLIDQPVQFKGSASGGYSPYTSWHWDFGDTHTSDEQNPSHTYTSAGNHTITLTVTDNTSNTSSDTTYAWIQVTNNPPNKPTIDGPTYGHFFVYYEYTFSATDPEGTPVWYYIDWDGPHGDTGWIGPSASGGEVVAGHWWGRGVYTIRCKAKDPYGEEGPWGTLKIRMPRSKMVTNSFFLKLLEKLPLL
jgi:outer membrane protein assembly factor BamB